MQNLLFCTNECEYNDNFSIITSFVFFLLETIVLICKYDIK